MVTISGVQFQTDGKRLTAPRSTVVLSYLKAVKDGKSLAQKILNSKKK